MLCDRLAEIDRERGLDSDDRLSVWGLAISAVFADNDLPALHVWPDSIPAVTVGDATDAEVSAAMVRYQCATVDALYKAVEQQLEAAYALEASERQPIWVTDNSDTETAELTD